MRFALAVAFLSLAASQVLASDGVFTTLSVSENPDTDTIFYANAVLSNSENIYNVRFSNKRAHGGEGRRFRMSVANGLQCGFSSLVENLEISVNGIPAKMLQLKKDTLRKWSGASEAEGVEFKLNFDGAQVNVRFWMRPDSPVLFGEVAKSDGGRQFTPITNVIVKVTAIPSYLECGDGRKTRFFKYARQVQTVSRRLELPPGRREKMRHDDLYFILQDGDYDGSEEGKGRGPSATWPISPALGRVVLNDSWTTSVEYAPDLSRPFRFALLEYRSVRISNSDFQELVKRLTHSATEDSYGACESLAAPSIRVGTYNIRYSKGDLGTPNEWRLRKDDLVALVKSLEFDVCGLQEVLPDQLEYLRECLPGCEFVGKPRSADGKTGEYSPVLYRKDRFDAESSGVFWLSETPDEPGSRGWGAYHPRVCTYAVLRDRRSGGRFCFANAHTDNQSAEAREKGVELIIRRMNDVGSGCPIVFVGDHNCSETDPSALAASRVLANALYKSETPPAGPWRSFTGWQWVDAELSAVEAMKMAPAVRNAGRGSPEGETMIDGMRAWERCGKRMDYVYVSHGVRVLDYATVSTSRPGRKLYPSDHFPIVATVSVARRPKASGCEGLESQMPCGETAELQRRIDAAARRGGGRVAIGPGVHWTGQLDLRSNIELHMEKGAVLKGLSGLEHYRVESLPYSEGTWSGVVVAMGVTNVSVTGEGVVDGNGAAWPLPPLGGGDAEGERARGMVFANCRGVRLEDFTLRDSGSWGCVFKCCDGVTVCNVKVDNHANSNNDGFDIEAKNVLIDCCDVDSGDDAYCLKSNDPGFTVENVRIRNCVARSHCNGFKIGTASHGTVRNVRFENCRAEAPRRDFIERRTGRANFGRGFFYRQGFDHLPNGVGLAALAIENVDGGTVEDITADNVSVSGFMCPIFIRGDRRVGRACGTPPSDRYVLRDITVRKLHGHAEGVIPSSVTGVDGCVVRNVTLDDIDIVCRGADGGMARMALETPVPRVDGAYPECTMFSPHILPAYGLYADRVEGLCLRNARFALAAGAADPRPSTAFTARVVMDRSRCRGDTIDFPALCATRCATMAAAEVPRWLSVMPLNADGCEELVRDCADLGNTTIVDGIAWSCAVNPEGNPVADRAAICAERYRSVAPKLRVLSNIQQGILLQSTMGHGGFPGSITPWQLAVKRDGTSVYRMCPMDGRFLDYIAKTCRTFSDLKPDFFMIDDDTRLVWGDTPGCFCPLHLAEFSKRTGREWTREEVVAMLDSGNNPAMADKWEAVKADSLRRFFKTIRENFSPEIPGMLCVTASPCHLKHAREFAQILAAPGQTPVVRGNGAPYHGRDLFHIVSGRSSYAQQLELVGKDVVFLQESDTCPHTLWATSATRTYDHLVMLALEGCKGAKIWITRTGNYHEKKSAQAYRRIFRENRGLMEWAAKADFEKHGVVIPVCGPAELNFGDRYLALTGIPYRFGKARPGEVTAVTADTLKLMRDTEIREILSGAVIADGSAALWLSDNGYSEYTGVRAKAWNGNTIQVHEFEDGSRQFGMRTGGLVDLSDVAVGAKIQTRLLNRPTIDGVAVYEAPGSVLYANPRGGRVLSFAQSLPVQQPSYYDGTLFSESYKAEIVKWLSRLGGGLPGGVCYLGAGPVTCEAGKVGDDMVFVLNVLDIDGDESPEMMFDTVPSLIERLQVDGGWKQVRFTVMPNGNIRLLSLVRTQNPAIFRWKIWGIDPIGVAGF